MRTRLYRFGTYIHGIANKWLRVIRSKTNCIVQTGQQYLEGEPLSLSTRPSPMGMESMEMIVMDESYQPVQYGWSYLKLHTYERLLKANFRLSWPAIYIGASRPYLAPLKQEEQSLGPTNYID